MADEFVVEPHVVGEVASKIHTVGEDIAAMTLETSFSTLSGAFKGATDPMTGLASSGDGKVRDSIKNAAGNVQGWSEVISGFKGAAISLDEENAKLVRDATALPSHQTVDPDNRH